jgi:germination protein M
MMKRRWLLGILIGILSLLLVSGCTPNQSDKSTEPNSGASTTDKPPTPVKPISNDTIPVKVYFGTHDARFVVAEVHQLKNDAKVMQRALEVLAAGPTNTDLVAVIPKATKVKSVVVRDKTAFVDFSAEIAKRGFGGSATEILAVGAIVNTLTEFPDVEKVQILVEGKRADSLFGHLDIYDPLSRSPGIIKGK